MAKSTTSKTPAARNVNKPAKTSAQRRPMGMAVAIDPLVDGEDAAIASLLAELSGEPPAAAASDEILIEAVQDLGDIREGEVSAEDLGAAIASAEATDEMVALAAPEVGDGTVTGDVSDVVAEESPESKVKKERAPRVHYANKADRIAARLGDKLAEYTVLTVEDAAGAIDDAALAIKMAETMTMIRGMSKKKQNRAGFLMEFVSGKSAKLNEVMQRAFKVLAETGTITTGKDGNLLANLLARPYSPAAARAMGANTVSVLEDLKLIIPDGKGAYRANSESLLLAKANALLGIGTTA